MSGHYLPVANATAPLYYSVQGNETGIPFLLVHGWTCDQTDWAFQIAFLVLAGIFRVIALDLRGHGRSSLPILPTGSSAACNTSAVNTSYDPPTFASDAAALLEHLGYSSADPAIVMGHSLGGAVVTELAHAHADLVRGIVLADPSYYLTPDIYTSLLPELESDFDATATDFFAASSYTPDTPDYIKDWHAMRVWGMDERVGVLSWEQLGQYQGEGGVDFIREKKVEGMPRLVVTAMEETAGIEREAGVDGEWERVETLEVGHWVMKTGADRFNGILEEWLREFGWWE